MVVKREKISPTGSTTSSRKGSPKKVLNPHTGRYVTVGGLAYKRMMETTKANTLEKKRIRKIEGVKAKYPYRETREWSLRAPKTVAEREEVYDKCGAKCFLIPKERKFPVCERGTKTCKADCGGLISAKIRARQWGYWPLVGDKMERLYKTSGCSKKTSPKTSVKKSPKRSF